MLRPFVERSEIYDSRIPHELTQDAPLAEHRTTFMIPGTNQPVTWKSGNHSVARSEFLTAIYAGYVVVLVSPTGIDGFCKGLKGSWSIPFKGLVNAA